MKRSLTAPGLACALCALGTLAAARDEEKPAKQAAGGIAGVKGTAFVIDGNKNKDTKLAVQPHDLVVIEWTYPVSPPFPRSAREKSSDPGVVKATGVRSIVNVKGPLGVGHLGATFEAEKKGTATLTFDVSHGSDDIKMTCEVEVK
jgi:hypothetical protein